MATGRINDARAFRDFLEARLAVAGDALALDEALSLWESENQDDAERDETIAAIRRGFEDIDAGRLRPAREAIDSIRRRHDLPPLP